MYTTLNKLRKHDPCYDGWRTLLKQLKKSKADDEPLHLLTILESNDLEDAIWALRAVDGHEREIRHFAMKCASQVQYMPLSQKSRICLDNAVAYTLFNTNTTGEAALGAAMVARVAREAAAQVSEAALDEALAAQEAYFMEMVGTP